MTWWDSSIWAILLLSVCVVVDRRVCNRALSVEIDWWSIEMIGLSQSDPLGMLCLYIAQQAWILRRRDVWVTIRHHVWILLLVHVLHMRSHWLCWIDNNHLHLLCMSKLLAFLSGMLLLTSTSLAVVRFHWLQLYLLQMDNCSFLAHAFDIFDVFNITKAFKFGSINWITDRLLFADKKAQEVYWAFSDQHVPAVETIVQQKCVCNAQGDLHIHQGRLVSFHHCKLGLWNVSRHVIANPHEHKVRSDGSKDHAAHMEPCYVGYSCEEIEVHDKH